MKMRSKRYKESDKNLDKEKIFQLKEAIALVKKMVPVKFDGSVDLHFNLNVDSKKSDQIGRAHV